jgi:hypothetical protein
MESGKVLREDRPVLIDGCEDATPFALGQLLDNRIEHRRLSRSVYN